MPADFVHLHVHTDYSLLDGACPIDGLLKMAQEYDMPAVAMTDHGFMGGAIDMYQTFTGTGVKPILGCETYVSPTDRFDKNNLNPDIKGFHLVLLAQNRDGYHSLCKLLSEAHLHGMYYKPRIDKEILAKYSKGLIGLSACIGGEISKNILNGKAAAAEQALADYRDILGKENFYLELMDHGMEEEKTVNRALIRLAKQYQVPLVATNDVHYLKKEHAAAHEIMLCIQTQAKLDEKNHFRFSSQEFYFKSPQEMRELFKEIPEALNNTLSVAERCNLKLQFVPEVNHYPVYNITDSPLNEKEYLRNICIKGIKECYNFDAGDASRLNPEQQAIIRRLDYELDVIDQSKYTSYFLVVWDFIHYAKSVKVPVGPGRGSGAGSLVAYLTRITDIDPLRYNLLFERFLNPERVSPPDFDIDFCEKRRGEVIEYVRKKYGSDSVAQIGTYGTLKAKAVLKDVARVLGHTFAEGDTITRLVPNDPKMTVAKAVELSSELREMIAKEEWVKNIFDYAGPLEGLNRNMSIHAAGVIIGDQRLDNLVPLAHGAGDEIITQFSAKPCENLGLLKMDFLGLKTLTVIQSALDNIRDSRNIDIDISKIPLDDRKTFDLLNRGDTVAVFQLESSGMQNLCRQFGVETIEHIIALIAIYRPGPMQFIPDFVNRKKGKVPLEYDHPKMEQCLKETYGIMLYQEQIMQVVQVLAGFTMGQADILRWAIGKKKEKIIAEQKEKFIQGCSKCNNISKESAEQIWEKIGRFAGYGFNKSHSAAYAFIAYRTAYLKANYPVEFMTAVLSSEIDNAEKIAFFINECREMNIQILPPDVNSSNINFTVDGMAVRFGLGAIKGVGEAAAGKIIESRQESGKYISFLDFCERAGGSLNSRMLEHLARAGAFDSLGLKRSQVLAIAEPTMSFAASRIKDRANGQGSLFDLLDDSSREEAFSIAIPAIPEFEEKELLQAEKELLGFYVTGHPLAKSAELIKTFSTANLRNAAELPDNTGIRVGGIIKSCQRKFSKNSGKPYAILELEDLDGTIECMVYSRSLEELDGKNISLEENKAVFVEALTSKRDETEKLKLIAEKILPMENAMEEYTQEIHLHVYEGSTTADTMKEVQKLCRDNPGKSKVVICVTCTSGEIVFIETAESLNTRVSPQYLVEIREHLGERRYRLKPDRKIPVPKTRFNNGNGSH